MSPLPHRYLVSVDGGPRNGLSTSAAKLPTLVTAAPAQFGGPGDQWSPETLLMAAAANCLVLTFRAIARASHLDWISLHCEALGTLENEDHKMRFTSLLTTATLVIPSELKRKEASRLLEKAERDCLISNSLNATREFKCKIEVSGTAG